MSDETKELGIIGVDEAGEAVIREPIFIKLSSYRNSKYLDVRKFYDEGGEWRPTKKGITLTKDQLAELLKIIKDNEKEINEWFE